MDEMSNIEARRDFNVANLRRAFAGLQPIPEPAGRGCRFADLLGRLAARDAVASAAPPERPRPRANT